jgi:hypothetical protein
VAEVVESWANRYANGGRETAELPHQDRRPRTVRDLTRSSLGRRTPSPGLRLDLAAACPGGNATVA